MNNVRSIENLTEAELKHNIFGGVSKGSWHEKYKNSAWVFLGGLPFELTEGDVICVMSQWGEIEDIHLVREKDTGKSRGFAFIKYEDARSTILAVDNMNGAKLLGQTLRCDHVDQYRLPKEVQEREAEQWEEQGGGSIDIGPGHAYKGKELANDFDISHGVNLWSSSSVKLSKKPTTQANYDKQENMANNVSKEVVSHLSNDQHSQLLPSSSPSRPEPQQARYGDEPSENYSREGYRSKRYQSSDDDSRGRSRSRSRDRKRDKKSKKEKKHKKHKRHHRDSRSRSPSCSDERHHDRKDRYDEEDDERRRRRDKEHRRSRSRERHRRDRDDDSRDGRSHRNRRSTRSSSRSPHRRDPRNESDDNRSTDSCSNRRQRDEAKKRADKKELEKAMLAAAMTATEILGPSTTGATSTAISNNSSSASGNNGNGLILAGGGPVASWRGRRDPEIRAKLAAAEKKLANAASFGTTGFKGNRDDVAGIGGAKRIR